jgi:hypothetical protein
LVTNWGTDTLVIEIASISAGKANSIFPSFAEGILGSSEWILVYTANSILEDVSIIASQTLSSGIPCVAKIAYWLTDVV